MESGGYFPVPNLITTLAPRVGFAAAWLYVLMLRHRDATGKCWPKQETLASESGMSVMTVRRAIERLQAEGLVTAERTGRANVFTVNNLIVLSEQSDTQERTIGQEVNNQMHTTEQSDCSVGTSPLPPSLPPEPPSLPPTPQREEKPERRPKKREVFAPPSSQEALAFIIEELHGSIADAENFFDHFSANGWLVSGKTPMKDWHAAARKWVRRAAEWDTDRQRGSPVVKNGAHPLDRRNQGMQETMQELDTWFGGKT